MIFKKLTPNKSIHLTFSQSEAAGKSWVISSVTINARLLP